MASQTTYPWQPVQYQGPPSQQVSLDIQVVEPRILNTSRYRCSRFLRHKDMTHMQARCNSRLTILGLLRHRGMTHMQPRFLSRLTILGLNMVSLRCLCRRMLIVVDSCSTWMRSLNEVTEWGNGVWNCTGLYRLWGCRCRLHGLKRISVIGYIAWYYLIYYTYLEGRYLVVR